MRKGISKRISALVSILLVVTVLFSGSVFASEGKVVPEGTNIGIIEKGKVENEGDAAYRFSRNSVYIDSITVYPVVNNPYGANFYYSNIKETKSFVNSSFAGISLTAAQRASLTNRFNAASSAENVVQNGWYVSIKFRVDSSSPLHIKGSYGGNSTQFNVSSGSYELSYHQMDMNNVSGFNGVLSFIQNGIGTSTFNAGINFKA